MPAAFTGGGTFQPERANRPANQRKSYGPSQVWAMWWGFGWQWRSLWRWVWLWLAGRRCQMCLHVGWFMPSQKKRQGLDGGGCQTCCLMIADDSACNDALKAQVLSSAFPKITHGWTFTYIMQKGPLPNDGPSARHGTQPSLAHVISTIFYV